MNNENSPLEEPTEKKDPSKDKVIEKENRLAEEDLPVSDTDEEHEYINEEDLDAVDPDEIADGEEYHTGI